MREKIAKYNAAVVVIIGIVVAALFLAVMDGTTFLCGAWTFPGYTQQMISELAAAVYVLVVLFILGYGKVLKDKGEGFAKGFYTGGFMTAYCIYVVVGQFYLQRMSTSAKAEPVLQILIFTFTMFLIGFNEELVFRGIMLNLFLDKFGNSKKGILISVILSGAIFGSVHLTNIFSGVSVGSAMIQALQAGLLGVLLAEIYLRTGNIWITIIAHALTDFASMLSSGIYGNGNFIDSINNLSAINFLAIPIFLIPTIVLFRKSKLEELVNKRNGMMIVPTEQETEHLSIVSLILGIFSIVMGCAGYGIAFGVVGLLGALQARKNSQNTNGMVIAGIATSSVGCAISIIMIVVMLIILPNAGVEIPF